MAVENEQNGKSTAETLIETAGRIFADKGLAATVREICGDAGCSIAAISYHFGDKQQLYLRCVQSACERKQRLFPVPKLDGSEPPAQALRSFLRAIAARVAAPKNDSWHSRLVLREILAPSESSSALLRANFETDFRTLEAVIGRLLGDALNSLELRQSFITQIFARCMFLRTGKELRRLLQFSNPTNETPELYADEICDSILLQIGALREAASQADGSLCTTSHNTTESDRTVQG